MFRDLRHKFNSDGFVVMDGFLTAEEADALKQEAEKLIENMPDKTQRSVFSATNSVQSRDKYFLDSVDKISYFYEEGALGESGELLVDPKVSLNKLAHALHEKNDAFKEVTLDERVKETCYQLGLLDPVVVQSMYIFKNPKIGGEVKPHQDATYLYTEPINVVGFWIALEDATLENGCLWFARGSHRSGVHRRYIRNPDKASDELLIYNGPAPYYQKSNFTAVPVKKGACIVIHGQVVHYSEANKSDKSRNVYTFHVVEQKNTKYSKENWLQCPENSPFLSIYEN